MINTMQRALRVCHPRMMLRCMHNSAPLAASTSADAETGQLPKEAVRHTVPHRLAGHRILTYRPSSACCIAANSGVFWSLTSWWYVVPPSLLTHDT